MTTTIRYSDSSKDPINIADNESDASIDLELLGKGYNNYSRIIATNFLHLLENFANQDSPPKPIEGQLWYKNNDEKLNYHNGNDRWKEICSLTTNELSVGTDSPPTNIDQKDGHFYLDTRTGNLWIYYDNEWRFIIDLGVSGSQNRLVFRERFDTSGNSHKTGEMIVDNTIVFIVSSDDEWEPLNMDMGTGVNEKVRELLEDGTTLLSSEFPEIKKGINLRGGDDETSDATGYGFHGTATSARYKDLAERYHADDVYEYGTVVELGGEKEITQTTTEKSTNVFGIISKDPAFIMNDSAGTYETHPPIALAGRVPVKVIGQVEKGDRLVSSEIPGHAKVEIDEIDPDWRSIIGRSLEDKTTDDAGIVEVVVGVK